jgi:hypothetical protein
MMRDLYESLTAREQRAIRWSWADPWFLLSVPLIAGGYYVWLKQHRRRGTDEPEEADWDY